MMSKAPTLPKTLPSIRVDVVELGTRVRRNRVRCEIGKNLRFDTAGLEAYCLATWQPLVFDAFVVAAAVQFCDHTKARPATGWGREIVLRVPVHDPAHWNTPIVSAALHEALLFLTGDQWNITFIGRKNPAVPPRQGQFSMPNGSRVITPFSDGLDSLAVAGLMKREYGNRLMRVRLGSKSLKRSAAGAPRVPFTSVPYKVHAGEKRFVETSARSRGFKFALLSGIAAYLSQAEQIIVPESGQGALGPTLVPVGQAYEDYRNHPLFMKHMESFLFALFGHQVRYIFPRLWFTKGETLAEYIADGPDCADWMETRSCWQLQRQVSVSGRMRQCGICAACMLRRLSIHAIGAMENKETYVWEDLTAARFEDGAASEFKNKKPKGALYEYAIAGTLHLDHLADLRHSPQGNAKLDRTVFQLSRALGEPQVKIQEQLDRLLERHEGEWKSFIHSLGPNSFVADWALRGKKHVA